MAVPYYGDFPEDATVYIPFNTFSSDDPSASVTISDLINTDIHIHKDGGTTQRNNAAGITMSVDYDSITGNHLAAIDTSDDTVADFWVTGSEYQVRMEGTTVDGATINAWIGAFSIERAGGVLALIKGGSITVGTCTTNTDMRGTDSAATAAKLLAYVQLLARSDAAIETDNATELTEINADGGSGAGNFSAQTDAVEALRDHIGNGTNLTEAGGDGDHLTAINLPNQTMDITGSITGNLIGDVTGNVDGTVAGVTPSSHAAADVKTAIEAAGSHLTLIKTKTDSLTFTGAGDVDCNVQTWKGVAAQDMTGDAYARLGAPAGASVSADVAAVKTQTGAIETDTQDIQSRIPAALTGAGNIKADSLAISGSTDAADNLEASAETIIHDTIDAGYTETTTTFKGGGTATLDTTDNHYNGRIVVFTSGNLQNQASDITGYNGTTKVFTVTALTEAPADGDSYVIV